MRIGIDVKKMFPEAGGIGRYLTEIIKALSSLPDSQKHNFILYSGKDTLKMDLPANWKYSKRKITSRGVVRVLLYPYIVRKDKLDIFYSADFLGPILNMPCCTITTVHDLIPIIYPELTSIKHKFVGQYLLPLSIKNASFIISVSEATKKDIIKYIDVPEKKINVILEGRHSLFSAEKNTKKNRFTDRPYIIFLGSDDPKKNLTAVLKAFSRITNSDLKNHILILCGNIDTKNRRTKQLIKNLNISKKILFTGFVKDEDLAILLSQARAFCFPSLYEGFGLPVLEAMACGCPVITSNVSSLPEVAGNAAILVDPNDINQISSAMTLLINDDNLYNDLKSKSIKQAEKFSWEKAAQNLLDIFASV